MRNPRIYTSKTLAINTEVSLESNAANHVGRVLRMKIDDPLIIFNSEQGAFQGRVSVVTKNSVVIKIDTIIESNTESPLRIELGQTISRGERMDYAIQKTTEMGIVAITPLFSERCEVKLNPQRQEKRVKHWQQVAISACEQSGRNHIPTINQPVSLSTWLKNRSTDLNFVLYHQATKSLHSYNKPASVSLLIGPEGGLTEEEVIMAEHHHFNGLSIGPRILRTETAPVVAASLLHYLWGDLC